MFLGDFAFLMFFRKGDVMNPKLELNMTAEREGVFTPLIVKVNQPGYVPPGMTVRARIDDYIFTADCESKAALDAVATDANVQSVSINSSLRSELAQNMRVG